jgi:hypothetical protein
MRKPASATVFGSQPLPSSQLRLVRGGDSPVVIVPSPPALKAERVQ